jgi:AcrR family transcriptional regulator
MALRLPAIERKEQVLDVALAVFAGKGFHDTSMNDIAEAAGVTKPVVYQHYESKRALFLAIIDHVGDRMIDVLTAATSGLTKLKQELLRSSIGLSKTKTHSSFCSTAELKTTKSSPLQFAKCSIARPKQLLH